MATEEKSVAWRWSDEDEALAEKWRRGCIGYRFMHRHAAREFKRRHKMLKFPAVILSAATSTSLFAGGADADSPMRYVFASCALAVTVLEALDQWLQLQQAAARHFASADLATRLLSQLANELSLPRVRRSAPGKFMEKAARDYDALLQSSNRLPACATSAFERHIRIHGLVGEDDDTPAAMVRAAEEDSAQAFALSVV